MNRVLAIIPARKGSKRVPDKNFKYFLGKPLFSWITESALKSSLITDIVINSDHERILEYAALNFPSVVGLKRPDELAADESPAIDYVNHTIAHMKSKYDKMFDVVVILQPSSPLTLVEDIDSTINLLINSHADSAVSVVKLDHMIHPVKLKTMKAGRLLPYLEEEKGRMAAHELPEVYVRNCAVYASKISVIENGKIIGDDCRGFVMPAERSVDINEMIDFEFAEFIKSKNR